MFKKISRNTISKINFWLSKFPRKQSAVLAALRFIQEDNGGFLSVELMDNLADYLLLPKIAVYEVASFYSMYELKQVGKYKICVCTNISCMLSGSEKLVNHIKEKLNISFNEVTTDNLFSLKEVECLASCDGAPVIQIGHVYYENVTFDKFDNIIAELK